MKSSYPAFFFSRNAVKKFGKCANNDACLRNAANLFQIGQSTSFGENRASEALEHLT